IEGILKAQPSDLNLGVTLRLPGRQQCFNTVVGAIEEELELVALKALVGQPALVVVITRRHKDVRPVLGQDEWQKEVEVRASSRECEAQILGNRVLDKHGGVQKADVDHTVKAVSLRIARLDIDDAARGAPVVGAEV